jgi:glycosyltransferase involved in cell wall biosynthesis
MRLTIWHFDAYPTAPGVYLDCFPRLGHDITWVVSTVGPRTCVLEYLRGGVRHFEVQRRRDSSWPAPLGTLANRWHKLRAFLLKARLMRRLAAERPDVLQTRDLITEALLGLACARLHGVRFAFQMDHPHPEGRLLELDCAGLGRPLERLVQRWWMGLRRFVLRRADVVFPLTEALAERLRDHEGVDPRRLVPFPVGVSRDTLAHGAEATVDARAAATAGHATVCYLGNLHARRDPGLLFRVLAEIAQRRPECRFLVVSRPTPEAERLMREFPAADRLVFTGYVPHAEVPALLRAARVGIFPLAIDDPYGVYRTSSPLKVMEYLSAGLPVVSSRVRDAEKVLGESGGGVCVENDAGVFADAVVAYLEDPERARRDGARGRAYIETHRLFDVLALEVEAAYRRLLATGWPSAPAAGREPRYPATASA